MSAKRPESLVLVKLDSAKNCYEKVKEHVNN